MEKKTTSVKTHFKKLMTGNVFSVLPVVYSKSHLAFFTSNVQYIHTAAIRRIQVDDAPDQWCDQ